MLTSLPFVLAQEVANRVANGSFDQFNALIDAGPAGNHGNIGFFINEAEIIPFIPVTGIRRFDAQGSPVESFAPEVEARAIVEGQMMSMYVWVLLLLLLREID